MSVMYIRNEQTGEFEPVPSLVGPQGPPGTNGDGAGTVTAVNNVAPDTTGNVTLTAANVGARPDTWTPTASDVGALPSDGTAVNAAQLNGKDAVYYLGARNLLDNSDFLDPVNQRGKAYVEGTGYSLDRWYGNSDDTKVSIEQGSGIIVVDSTLVQNIEHKYIGKTLTIAACGADGNVTVSTGTVHDPDGYKWICATDSALYVGILQTNTGELRAHIRNSEYKGRIVWAALYEGSYTADNLPPYVAPDPVVELAKCMRYAVDVENAVLSGVVTENGVCEAFLPLNVSMRKDANPTVTIKNALVAYTADGNNHALTFTQALVRNTGLLLTFLCGSTINAAVNIPTFNAFISADL